MRNAHALVIVDAWEHSLKSDTEAYGIGFTEDIKTFSVFLNNVCNRERNSGTIIIHSSEHPVPSKSKEIIKEINIHPNDIIISKTELILDVIKQYKCQTLYFCGFHFGQCIQRRVAKLIKYEDTYNFKSGIVINLSMVLPGGKWGAIIGKPKHLPYQHNISYYFWYPPNTKNGYSTSNNFDKILIK